MLTKSYTVNANLADNYHAIADLFKTIASPDFSFRNSLQYVSDETGEVIASVDRGQVQIAGDALQDYLRGCEEQAEIARLYDSMEWRGDEEPLDEEELLDEEEEPDEDWWFDEDPGDEPFDVVAEMISDEFAKMTPEERCHLAALAKEIERRLDPNPEPFSYCDGECENCPARIACEESMA